MAGLASASYPPDVLSTFVLDQLQPTPKVKFPEMPPTAGVEFPDVPLQPRASIVIEDDEDDSNVEILPRPTAAFDNGGPSNTRPLLDPLPVGRRNSKRLKTWDDGPAEAREFGLNLNEVENDDAGFFYDAFTEEPIDLSSDDPNLALIDTPKKKKQKIPPYTYDPTYDMRMYCAPPFEHFPVPADLDPTHKEICDIWDARVQARRGWQPPGHLQYAQASEVLTDESDADEGSKSMSNIQQQCFDKVVAVLPDIEHNFLRTQIRAQHESYNFDGDVVDILEPNKILAEVLEADDYPRQQNRTATGHEDDVCQDTGKTITWNKDHYQNPSYLRDATALLAQEYAFQHVPTKYIHDVLRLKRSLWDVCVYLDELERSYFDHQVNDQPYRRLKHPRHAIEKKYETTGVRDPRYYARVILELQAARQHTAREALKLARTKKEEESEKANFEQHKLAGGLVVCHCCYETEVPLNRAVSCTADEGHTYCFTCINSLASTQVGMMKHEMTCMDSDSECKARLNMNEVGKAIPRTTLNRLLLNEQQAEIIAANIEGLEQCPFCDFKAICEPIEVDTIFGCRNLDCFKVSCRKCHEITHLPRTCEEAKNDRGLNARHQVEEARSEATMRSCPKCRTKIIKELGCNKMRCNCGAVMCYYCGMDLSDFRDGYEHFNKGAKKCPLYDPKNVDYHAQQADDAEREAIKKVKAKDKSIDEKELQIETGKPAAAAPSQPAVRNFNDLPEAERQRILHGRAPLLGDHMEAAGHLRVPRRPRVRARGLQPNAREHLGLPARPSEPTLVPGPPHVAVGVRYGDNVAGEHLVMTNYQPRHNLNPYNDEYIQAAQRIHGFREENFRRRLSQEERRAANALFNPPPWHPVFADAFNEDPFFQQRPFVNNGAQARPPQRPHITPWNEWRDPNQPSIPDPRLGPRAGAQNNYNNYRDHNNQNNQNDQNQNQQHNRHISNNQNNQTNPNGPNDPNNNPPRNVQYQRAVDMAMPALQPQDWNNFDQYFRDINNAAAANSR